MGTKKDDAQQLKSAVAGTSEPKEVVHAPQSQQQTACNDIVFAALFLIAFGFTVGLAIMYGSDVLTSSANQDEIVNAQALFKEKQAKYKYALKISAAIAGGALVASVIWTLIMLVCGKMLIWCVYDISFTIPINVWPSLAHLLTM